MSDPDFLYVRHVESKIGETSNFISETSSSLPADLNDVITTRIQVERQKMIEQMGKIIKKKHLSTGVWEPKERIVRIVVQKSLNQYQPQKNCLSTFEALFYMECRSLVVEFNGIMLSIQDAYRIFLSSKNEHMRYVVFASLSRLGYFVHCVEQSSNKNNDQEKIENVRKNKKIKTSPNSNEENEKNFNIVHNVRSLLLNQMRKLNRFDRKLLSDSNLYSIETSKSIIYDVSQSSEALQSSGHELYDDAAIKPLLSLGEIPTCEELFEKLQKFGPKEYCSAENSVEKEVTFSVYKNRKEYKNNERLFDVIICEPYDKIPTIENISEIEKKCPILYCIINDTLEFGFFKVDDIKLKNKYPILWRAIALEL